MYVREGDRNKEEEEEEEEVPSWGNLTSLVVQRRNNLLFLDDISTSQRKRKDDRRKKESFRVESESKVIEEELDMTELEEDHRRTEMPTTSIVANHGSSIPLRSVGSFSIPAIITGSLSLFSLLEILLGNQRNLKITRSFSPPLG
jgi:hypothetical protein